MDGIDVEIMNMSRYKQ